jgi:hypothetical protein
MKKLTLKIDQLTVDSFETVQARGAAGTVHAAEGTPHCSEQWTCGIWCPETTDPQPTAPCQCPEDTQAPVC